MWSFSGNGWPRLKLSALAVCESAEPRQTDGWREKERDGKGEREDENDVLYVCQKLNQTQCLGSINQSLPVAQAEGTNILSQHPFRQVIHCACWLFSTVSCCFIFTVYSAMSISIPMSLKIDDQITVHKERVKKASTPEWIFETVLTVWCIF